MKHCLICGKEINCKVNGYCSAMCGRESKRRSQELLEKKEEILDDMFEMLPELWSKIRNTLTKKYKTDKHRFSNIFKEIACIHFKVYPSIGKVDFVLYVPGQHEEASKIYVDSFKDLDPKVKSIMYNNRWHNERRREISRMWRSGYSAKEIAGELNVGLSYVKRIVVSL